MAKNDFTIFRYSTLLALDPEKVAIIRQMGDDGKNVKEIAAETGVSEPTVRKYLT